MNRTGQQGDAVPADLVAEVLAGDTDACPPVDLGRVRKKTIESGEGDQLVLEWVE
jgi:hypothetical protein